MVRHESRAVVQEPGRWVDREYNKARTIVTARHGLIINNAVSMATHVNIAASTLVN